MGDVLPIPSARASTNAFIASIISRPAAMRCSTTSGRTWSAAVSANPIGQNPTGHTGWWPRGASSRRSSNRSSIDLSSPFGADSHMRGPRLASEPDLEAVGVEPRLLDGEPLQGLRQDDVALVRADPDVQLVA